MYGPGSVPWTIRPVQHLRRRVFTHVDPARAVLNHVYVDNLLDGIDLLLERRASGRAYHVTDGARTLQRDFFAHYQRMLGQRLVPSTPYPVALAASRLAQSLPRSARDFLDLPPDAVRGIGRTARYSDARIRALGFVPAVGLDEGMARTEEWLRGNGMLG